jgi:hypothetical protein
VIWGRIKTWVIGVLVALMPVVYVFGRREGDKEREIEFLRNSAETNDEIADFYRRMGEFPDEDPDLDTRRGLADRLRNEGL